MTILSIEAKNNPYVDEPIGGWNRADHPVFLAVKEAHSFHRTPEEMLPGAKSVFAYFLPFTAKVVDENRISDIPSKLWAEAYIGTNHCIKKTSEAMIAALKKEGYRAVAEPATHNFNPETLVSAWSHKHIAYACGLGSFGLHHMLITAKGCAGRFGSIVTDLLYDGETHVLERHEGCLHYSHGICRQCVKRCPTGALTVDGLDKQRCYDRCLETDRSYPGLGLCDVCGKCAVGPCGRRDAHK